MKKSIVVALFKILVQNINKKKEKRNPNLSPYGLCIYSLYNSQDKTRKKMIPCDKILKFEKYDINILRAYAKEKKVKSNSKWKI